MKELHLLDNRLKFLVIIIFFIALSVTFILFLTNWTKYDLKIIIKISDNDISVLENRLKSIKVNNFKIVKRDNKKKTLFLKTSSLEKNYLSHNDIMDILLSNHSYQVFLIAKTFSQEISKYIQSDYTYPIDFKAVITTPVIEGTDIDDVKIYVDKNNLGEDVFSTEIKYTKFGKSKNEFVNKQKGKNQIEITLLDGQFWSYSRGNSLAFGNLFYSVHPTSDLIYQFRKIGKNYSFTDIRNIALFSKYSFNDPVKLIEIKEINGN